MRDSSGGQKFGWKQAGDRREPAVRGDRMAKRADRAAMVILYVLFAVVGLLCFIARPVIDWAKENFGVSIQEVLFKSPMKGADTGFLSGAVLAARENGILFLAIFLMAVALDIYLFGRMKICIKVRFRKWHFINARPVCYLAVAAVAVWALASDYQYLDSVLGISEYLEARAERTEIYEKYYVDPLETQIVPQGKTKNLIYIYMESMACDIWERLDDGLLVQHYVRDSLFLPG